MDLAGHLANTVCPDSVCMAFGQSLSAFVGECCAILIVYR